jgi:hypothetical protein
MAGAEVDGGRTYFGYESSSGPEEEENPMMDSGREQRADEAKHESKMSKKKRAPKAPQFSLGKLRGSEGVDTQAIERALLRHGDAFEACYLAEDLSGTRRLVLRLGFDTMRNLVSVSVKTDKLDSDAARRCLMRVLSQTVSWTGLPSTTSAVVVELVLRD